MNIDEDLVIIPGCLDENQKSQNKIQKYGMCQVYFLFNHR